MNKRLVNDHINTDWHQHSTFSDGLLSPTELVIRAKRMKLSTMALTDHDTIGGLSEAMVAGQQFGVKVVPGIEISAAGEGQLHILGYYIDSANHHLIEACEQFAADRQLRVYRIIAFLETYGISLSVEDIKAYSGDEGIIARPHVARAMVAKGYVASREEAFERYLAIPAFAATTERQKPSSQEAISLILEAGGIPCLAHPFSLELQGGALFSYIGHLKQQGLQAIEVYHPTHHQAFTQMCKGYAKELGLLTTRGSDFHGD